MQGFRYIAAGQGFIRDARTYVLPNVAAVWVECDFVLEDFADAEFATLGIACPPSFERAVAKRKAEFLAGRWCADRAMQQLGLAPVEIGVGEHRAPLWPPQLKGSITHVGPVADSVATACCALAQAENCQGIGIDLENIMTGSVAADTQAMLLADDEVALLASLQEPWAELVTLVFSAKESLFKALYPSVGRYFDFLDAKLVALDWDAGSFALALKVDLAKSLTKGARFQGQFVRRDHRILTVIQY